MDYAFQIGHFANRKFETINRIYQFTWKGYLVLFCFAVLALWILEVPNIGARIFILALSFVLFYLCIFLVRESADWRRESLHSRLLLFKSEREFVLVICSQLAKIIYMEEEELHYYNREIMQHYTRIKKVQRVVSINNVPFESRFVFVSILPGSYAKDLSLGMQWQQDDLNKLAEGARAVLIQPGPPEGCYKDYAVMALSGFKEKCIIAMPKPRAGELSFDMELFQEWVFGLAGVPVLVGCGFFAFNQEGVKKYNTAEKAVESRGYSDFELGNFLNQNKATFLPKAFIRKAIKQFNAYLIIMYLISLFALSVILALMVAPVALIASIMTVLKIVGMVALFLYGVSLIDWEGFVEDLPILFVVLCLALLLMLLTDNC